MNLDYEKIRAKVEHGGNHWTSYSDLFLVLSVVFLLLFVVANLRSGASSVSAHTQLILAKQEAEDLRKQIKAYETVKEEYLGKEASPEQVAMYQELMGQLTLLEDENNNKKKELRKAAKDAADKEKALNQYQAMVKNIINANMVANSKLKKRADIIEVKETYIDDLSKDVAQKEAEIAKNNATIENIETALEKQINEVKYAYRSKKRSQEKMKEEIARLESESEKKVASLRSVNSKYMTQLQQAQAEIEAKQKEAEQLLATMNQKEKKFQGTISELTRAHEDSLARERKALEQGLQKEADYQAAIARKNEAFQQKMAGLNSQLEATRGSIKNLEEQYKGKLQEVEGQYKGKLQQVEGQYEGKIKDMEGKYKGTIASLEGKYKGEIENVQNKYENELKGLEGKYKGDVGKYQAELQNVEGRYKAAMKDLEGKYQGAIKGMEGKYQGQIKDMAGKFQGEISGLKAGKAQVEGELKIASDKLNAMKQLAKSVKDAFGKAGIDADVDLKTGDVTINFANEYFETGSSGLKPGMQKILRETFPIYASSLMQDRKLAEKISNVEIIGFASPTYKGKYINPDNLDPEARKAVNYNMDLSYQRAKSIFEHVTDPGKMQYTHQKALLPKLKVSGRSYLATERPGARSVADDQMTDEKYCQLHDCKKTQKVIIKFNLRDE